MQEVHNPSNGRLILHAPNVHNGGGLSLLNALLSIQPCPFDIIQLDSRVTKSVNVPDVTTKQFVKKSIISRLCAEWKLKKYCQSGDVVVCLNGVPPLFSLSGKSVVLLQNCLLFLPEMIVNFPWQKKIRLKLERYWLLHYHKNVSRFIVQSNSMKQLAQAQLNSKALVSIFPFVGMTSKNACSSSRSLEYDFVYVANGEPHKNHNRLLDSWLLLANENIKPSLALTIDENLYPELSAKIYFYREKFGLSLVNLGCLTATQVQTLYKTSKALIYPSLGESLGLPLVEAFSQAIPILASERDYVRDVVEPTETFDPASSISIMRAVKRFLKIDSEPVTFHTPLAFINEIQS